MLAEVRLEQGLHRLQQQLLHEAIQHVGDAQWPGAASGLGDLLASRGAGLEAALQQLGFDPLLRPLLTPVPFGGSGLLG
jgi:hypothetical protein